MSNWRNNLRPSSYGGIFFKVDDITETRGRRVAQHNLIGGPVRIQDLGLANRTITVRGYIADDLTPNSDPYTEYKSLEAFVETGTRGTFSHPHYGRISNCLATSIADETRNSAGGVVRFTLNITLSADSQYIVPAASTSSVLESASTDLRVGSIEYFSGQVLENDRAKLLSADPSETAFQSPQSPIEQESWFNKITEFGEQIKGTRGALFGGAQARLDRVLGSISGPLNTVNEATSIMADIDFIFARFQDAPTSLRGLQSMLNYYSRRPFFPVNGNTSYHRRARHNEQVFNLSIVGLTSSFIGRTLSSNPIRGTFDSRADAVAYIDSVEDSIHLATSDFLEDGVTPDALGNLQTAIANYSNEFLPQVAQVRTVESDSRNAAVVSHRYLENADSTRRLVEENNAISIFDLPREVEVRRV